MVFLHSQNTIKDNLKRPAFLAFQSVFFEGGSRLVFSSLNERVFCLLVYHATSRRQVFTADRPPPSLCDIFRYPLAQACIHHRKYYSLPEPSRCGCAWTVLSFAEANTKTALCFATLAEQRRDTTTPAIPSSPATPVTVSSTSPATNPIPEASRPAPTVPVTTQVVPKHAAGTVVGVNSSAVFFCEGAHDFQPLCTERPQFR